MKKLGVEKRMKFLDKITKGLDDFEKKMEASIEKDKQKWSEAKSKKDDEKAENPDKKGFFEDIREEFRAIDEEMREELRAIDAEDINATVTKDDVTNFLHVINEQNYPSTEEHHLALKDFFFDNSLEAKNFTISKQISIGMRTGSRREISHGRNPLIELFIDDINQRFVLFDLRNRGEQHFYHFNEILDFTYDEVTNVSGSNVIDDEVMRMSIIVKLNRLSASLSIPFFNYQGGFFTDVQLGDDFYQQQRKNVDEVLAALTYMKNTTSTNNTPTANEQAPIQANVADELRKFKQLQEEGLISAEDFEAKKKQLLGI